MNDTNAVPPGNAGAPAAPPAEPKQEPLEAWVTKAFVGPDGIRAGWRLLIFLGMVAVLVAGFAVITLALGHGKPPKPQFTAGFALMNEALLFFIVLFASWVMSKMEHRRIADYGLPLRGALGLKFWQGSAIGFASITVLLVAMRLAGAFHFGGMSLHGIAIVEYAAAWGAAFLFVGFFEEFTFRGYALFTLTTGTKFWPAAALLSVCFGMVHRSNAGESWVGVFAAGLVGLLFCLILRRTGNLWMPIGFHAAWDWGESYFYGVPDSGTVSPGHLLNASFSGPAWLTGGTVGPEGSWLCVALLVILFVIFALWLPEAKYPEPDALSPRKRAEELPKLFPSES
jgi:CAAX protease family protein